MFLPGSLHVAHMPVLPYPHPGFGLILIFKPTRHKPLGRFGLEKTGSSDTCQMKKKNYGYFNLTGALSKT